MQPTKDKTNVTVKVRGPKRKGSVKVSAHYYRIQDGCLIFRNNVGGNQYPETVAVFAAGHWLEVIRDVA